MGNCCASPPPSRYQVIELSDDASECVDFHLYRGTHVVWLRQENLQWTIKLIIFYQKEGAPEGEQTQCVVRSFTNIEEEFKSGTIDVARRMKNKIDKVYKKRGPMQPVQEAEMVVVDEALEKS